MYYYKYLKHFRYLFTRDNLGTTVYSFWACSPRFEGLSYMLYSAEISRINGKKKYSKKNNTAQKKLQSFYDELVDFLKKMELVTSKTTLAEYCKSKRINKNKDLFLFIYAGDYVSYHFCDGEKRYYNSIMEEKVLNSLSKYPGFTEESYVLNLMASPDVSETFLVSNFFPILDQNDIVQGTDQNDLINFIRRNHLGFAEYNLQVQATQLLIRYLKDNNKFYIFHCAHCWAFLTLDKATKCDICYHSENWPKRFSALLCNYCATLDVSSSHKGIREQLIADGLLN